MNAIKVLYPINNVHSAENPYVSSLMDDINEMSDTITITDSLESFWNDNCFSYDIIHIMWPQYVLDGHNCSDLLKRLQLLKEKNIRIVSTCHNFVPHYNHDRNNVDSYSVVYSNCDEIYHLGTYSMELFKTKYPNTSHVLLYHQVYTKRYDFFPSKQESLEYLKLSPVYTYVLCFGMVRNHEERKFLLKIARRVRKDNLMLVVPSFFPINIATPSNSIIKNCIKRILLLLHYLYCKVFYRNLLVSQSNKVAETELPYYFMATDLSLIYRLKILNSGNLPLSFHYGKTTIGPDVGNVGEILRLTGNPVFNVTDFQSVIDALREGLKLSKEGRGDQNKRYASNNWSQDIIASQQACYYENVVTRPPIYCSNKTNDIN
jgi:hypothetical protein